MRRRSGRKSKRLDADDAAAMLARAEEAEARAEKEAAARKKADARAEKADARAEKADARAKKEAAGRKEEAAGRKKAEALNKKSGAEPEPLWERMNVPTVAGIDGSMPAPVEHSDLSALNDHQYNEAEEARTRKKHASASKKGTPSSSSKKGFGLTSHKGFPRPDAVKAFSLKETLRREGDPTGGALTDHLFCAETWREAFHVGWSESNMRENYFTPFLNAVRYMLKKAGVWDAAWVRVSEPPTDRATLIPDTVFYLRKNLMDLYAFLVVECKAPFKYTHERANGRWVRAFKAPEDMDGVGSMAAYYEMFEAAGMPLEDHSPVAQVYVYMCVLHLRYGVLTTGALTWFLRRECEDGKDVLYISESFTPLDTDPSLGQAMTYIILKAAEASKTAEGRRPPPPGHEVVLAKCEKKVVRKQKEQRRDLRSDFAEEDVDVDDDGEDDDDDAAAASSSSAKGKKRRAAEHAGDDDTVELPLDEVRYSLAADNIIETFGRLNPGVAHRLDVEGLDAVVKLVDALKDEEGAELFDAEASKFMALQRLWLKAVPALIFTGRDNFGRAVLITSYAGPTLWREPRRASEAGVEKQARAALQAIHDAGWLHGDVAARNIAVSAKGKLLFLDLGGAWPQEEAGERGKASPAEAKAAEMAELAAVFKELRDYGSSGDELEVE